ncbi:hypothetical protein SEA_CROSBY_57 [Streptomyces phage Crosby]|nr:hypothetical protein SEA_CROSBY_57 [Streptomyces phage Crosby]
MAKRQDVIDFINHCCVLQSDASTPMPEFRAKCQAFARQRGHNAPTGRLISRVLSEEYGVHPAGLRYEWSYIGIRFGVGFLDVRDPEPLDG